MHEAPTSVRRFMRPPSGAQPTGLAEAVSTGMYGDVLFGPRIPPRLLRTVAGHDFQAFRDRARLAVTLAGRALAGATRVARRPDDGVAARVADDPRHRLAGVGVVEGLGRLV